MTALLGIDVGTTNVKTCVYTEQGALLQDRVFPTPTTTDAYGRFHFSNLAPGAYDLQVMSGTSVVAHYQVHVNADQTLTVYGWAFSIGWHWEHEWGPHWNDMPQGAHWGSGGRDVSEPHDHAGWAAAA